MSLQHIPLRDITIQDIDALVENGVRADNPSAEELGNAAPGTQQ